MANLTGKERFRFIHAELVDNNKRFTGAQPALNNDNDGIASNGLWTACPWSGQGSFALFTNRSYRKFDNSTPLVKGHTGNVNDVAFYPFRNDLVASASADMTVKIWQCPKEDLKSDLKDAVITLKGQHSKGVTNIRWHSFVENTLATGGVDQKCFVWDVENQKATMRYDELNDQVVSLRWSPSGNQLAVM